jgi:lysine 2,3-aminomutase
MSSFLTCSKLNGAIQYGLHFRRVQFAMKAPNRVFTTSQVSSFQSAAKQMGQAGLARALEREYIPEELVQSFPKGVIHPPVSQKMVTTQSVENCQKNLDAAKVQGSSKTVIEKTSIVPEPYNDLATIPAYHRGSKFERIPYWQKIGRWSDITEKQFLSYRWGVS